MPLPQFKRDQGWLPYLAATGGFTLHGGFGVNANMRVVEIRGARMENRTGDIHQYNFLFLGS